MLLPSPDHERLRAIGRIRACLFHCGGLIRAPGLLDDLEIAAGARSGFPLPGPSPARLVITAATLRSICQLYDSVGAVLMDLYEKDGVETRTLVAA